MAAPPAAQIVSPFPTPPAYYQFYTSDNIANARVPLPPCAHADFTVFGEDYHLNDEIIRPLSEAGIRQLYVNKKDWKTEMKKLNSSAVAAFVDLVSILISCPDSQDRVDKLNDIRDIFINMHHLINEFRPIQARDTLRMMQQKQLDELERTVNDFKDFLVEAKKAFRQSLKVDEVVRLPIPAYRPDLEGPVEEPKRKEETKKREIELAMIGLSVGGERKQQAATSSSTPRPEQQQRLLQKRAMDHAAWSAIFGETMEE
ncbi:let-49 [Pristionchus pacificus]|uniref:Mediator of RNA polymerase II transcription subunit 7 n=1 Tax=Pristionchus pacificus TaxID=54126 RepID=A0A454XYX7_PRIPA|nr:let-49 [Pristionchus pacificus]|eukprot:PDM69442.1 let-49 [Pristionchus pacificus]